MTIKIEIPANNQALVRAIGAALADYEEVLPPGYVTAALDIDLEVSDTTEGEKKLDEELTDLKKKIAGGPGTQATKTPATEKEDNASDESPKNSGANVDQKGVMFVPAICGNSKDPFYASGPRRGQWKKKRGVSEEEYDKVYAQALSTTNILETPLSEMQEDGHDAKNAFGEGKKEPLKTIQDKTANDVFDLFSALAKMGHSEAANEIFVNEGLSNGTLIFANPHLINVIYPKLAALQISLQGAQ